MTNTTQAVTAARNDLRGLFSRALKGMAFASELESAMATLEAAQSRAQDAPVAVGAQEPHLFEFWWAEYMPKATQARAWEAFQAATRARGVGVVATHDADQASPKDWGIDTSTGTPILVYKNCSVIESEQARYVLRLIATEQAGPVSVMGDSVDAQRYRFLRDGDWRDTALEPVINLQLNLLWDEKIDAAILASKEVKA